jgi:hypothetical protein
MSSLPRRTSARKLAASILADRERRKSQARSRWLARARVGSAEDPFAPTNWRIIAGDNPGHMPKKSMRKGADSFWLRCNCCAREFQSLGLRFCADCMALSAEERRRNREQATSDRRCQCPGCDVFIPKRSRADAQFCSKKCAQKARRLPPYQIPRFEADKREKPLKNQSAKNVLIGPTDFPINVIGGYRFPRAKPVPRGVP